MKYFASFIAVIAAILLVGGLFVVGQYNSLVDLKAKTEEAMGNIDVQLQRRADLIPNLVNTVKGFTKHEQEIIDSITTARQNLVNAQSVSEKSKANSELTSALNGLLVVIENYPDIKSSQNFIQLQDELAGTENRLATARKDYNEAVTTYNAKIKKFPSNIIAGMFNYDKVDLFTADEESQKVPNVEF